MSNLLDELRDYLERLAEQGGMILLPTDASVIARGATQLTGVHRDAIGIVMQYSADDESLDGGDSANRTGLLAFCGSAEDQDVLPRFENGAGVMVRHPTQAPWDYPHNCSRDQLIAYVAGCWRTGKIDIARRLLAETERRNMFCQNDKDKLPTDPDKIPDPVLPHEHMFLRVCAGQTHAHWDLAGQWLLQATIEAVKYQEDPEINQLVVESIVCCRLDHFVKHVPDYEKRLNDYWSGWRNMPEVATALANTVRKELERYHGFIGLPFPPLPLAEIKNVIRLIGQALEEIKKGNLPHLLDPTKLAQTLEDFKDFLEAARKDAEAQVAYYLGVGQKLFEIALRLPGYLSLPFGPFGLLGSPRDDDLAEVKRLLEEISSKLDEVLNFLKRDLPKVMQAAVEEAISKIMQIRVGVRVVNEVIPALGDINDPVNHYKREKLLEDLKSAATSIVEDSCTAVRVTPCCAPVLGQVFANVLAVGGTLMRADVHAYGRTVSGWCENIVAALSATLDTSKPSPLTLALASANLPSLKDATEAARLIPPDTQALYVWWGVRRTKEGFSPYALRMVRRRDDGDFRPSKMWRVIAYGAQLHHFNLESNEWQIDDNKRREETFPASSGEPPSNVDWLPWHGENYYRMPWWTVIYDFSGDWVDNGRQMKKRAEELTGQSKRLAARQSVDAQLDLVYRLIDDAGQLHESVKQALGEPHLMALPEKEFLSELARLKEAGAREAVTLKRGPPA